MQPRELPTEWRKRAPHFGDRAIKYEVELCASELESALAEHDWIPLADVPLGVPLELWGREPTLQGVQPYEGGGWSLRTTLDTTWSDDPRPIFASHGLTHARLVTPPPCAREGDDG